MFNFQLESHQFFDGFFVYLANSLILAKFKHELNLRVCNYCTFIPLLNLSNFNYGNCHFIRIIFDFKELPESSKTFGKLNGVLLFLQFPLKKAFDFIIVHSKNFVR